MPLTDLTISSLCVYLKSHGWLAVDVPMASKGKEAIEKSGPFERRLSGATAAASATRWHHWPLWKHHSCRKPNPWSPVPTPQLFRRPVSPQRTWDLSVCRCRHSPPPQRRHLSLVAAPSRPLFPNGKAGWAREMT